MHNRLKAMVAGLYLCIGDPFLPGKSPKGSAWSILVVWVGAQIGSILAEAVRSGTPPSNHICTLRNCPFCAWHYARIHIYPSASSAGWLHPMFAIREHALPQHILGTKLDTAPTLSPEIVMCWAWRQVNIPAPVGMIFAGMFLKNVPSSGVNQGILLLGFKPSWSNRIREAALAIIFLRSGLEIDLAVSTVARSLRPQGSPRIAMPHS